MSSNEPHYHMGEIHKLIFTGGLKVIYRKKSWTHPTGEGVLWLPSTPLRKQPTPKRNSPISGWPSYESGWLYPFWSHGKQVQIICLCSLGQRHPFTRCLITSASCGLTVPPTPMHTSRTPSWKAARQKRIWRSQWTPNQTQACSAQMANIRESLASRWEEVILCLALLVRPYLEYGIHLKAPQDIREMEELRSDQWWVTRIIKGLEHLFYEKRLRSGMVEPTENKVGWGQSSSY